MKDTTVSHLRVVSQPRKESIAKKIFDVSREHCDAILTTMLFGTVMSVMGLSLAQMV
jgi:hypothetical protein